MIRKLSYKYDIRFMLCLVILIMVQVNKTHTRLLLFFFLEDFSSYYEIDIVKGI